MNFSRFIIEHPVCQLLGYLSYTMYLFQHVAFEFYGHIIADHASSSPSSPYYNYPSSADQYNTEYAPQWFRNVNEGYQTLGVLVLVVFCYLVQKYFQDTFIAGLVTRFLL